MSPPPVTHRLRTIHGQVAALIRMVDDGEDCLELINQAASLKAAIDQVAIQLLEDHARTCLLEAVRESEEMGHEEAVTRLVKVFERFARS